MKKNRFYTALGLFISFLLWTLAVRCVNVRAIGPLGSRVGFASVNGFVHNQIGVHMTLYTITDWMGLVPLGFVMGFALLGLVQWIKRKHLTRVDPSLLLLGAYYVLVMAIYLLFEFVAINYRPVLIEGMLEASYPSSTTMLAACVMPTVIFQLRARIKHLPLKRCVTIILIALTTFMILGRLISGVHWITDIIGAVLLSAGLVTAYFAFEKS